MYASFRSPARVRAKLQAALFHARQKRVARLALPALLVQEDLTQNENTAFSLELEDGTGDWTTSVAIDPAMPQLTFDGRDLAGTLPLVDRSTAYLVTVSRTNRYGTRATTFRLTVLNVQQSEAPS